MPLAKAVQNQLVSGDADAATASVDALVGHARSAVALTDDPVWAVYELLPWIGPNMSALRKSAAVTDTVASGAVQPLVGSADQIGLSSLQPVGGRIDIDAIIAAQPSVATARTAIESAVRQVDAIDTDGLVVQLADAVGTLKEAVHEADDAIVGVDNAVALMPPMLGADGPRNYLLIFQNPAELRAGGGITSALAMVHTDGGAVTLAQQASATDFRQFSTPAVTLPEETRGLFQDKAAQFVQNTTLVPEFELSGQIAAAMWADRFGTAVDGVLAFDPVGLSYLLSATGPIDINATGDRLNADNAVSFLLSDVYARYPDPATQDAVFADVAKAVFQRISAGDIDQKKLLDAMIRSGQEQRLKIWSSRTDEQAVLAGTSLAGSLPTTTATATGVGVYFNDATGAKMDYYLSSSVSTTSQMCRDDGRPVIRVSVTITNNAPADASTALPEYVTGDGRYGVPPGNINTYVYVYGPAGPSDLSMASIALGVDPGLEGASSRTALDQGHTVAEFPVELAPGQSRTMTVDFLAQKGDSEVVTAQITPMVTPSFYESVILHAPDECEIG